MAGENGAPLSAAEKQELATLIQSALVSPPADKQVKALSLGINFRVDVFKALKAAWYATKVCTKTARCILSGTVNPVDALEIGYDAWNAVSSTIQALVERMTALEYTACVHLASLTDPVTEQEFKTGLTEFLTSGKGAELPWYMGMTRSRVERSLSELQAPDGFEKLMAVLRKNDWLNEEPGKLKYKPRHMTMGIKAG